MSAAPIPGVVFDCNIFLQAAVSNTGPSFACLSLVEIGLAQLFVCTEILNEVSEVLRREKTRRKFPFLTPAYVDAYLQWIVSMSTEIENVPAVFTHSRDPKDEVYVNLAIATEAGYLVSRDKDLLDLKNSVSSLRILDPVAFLRDVVALLD